MKKITFFLLVFLGFRFISVAQCNMTVEIDSIVVRPCAFVGGGGGSCGCGNTLWAVVTGGTPPYTYKWTPSTGVSPDNMDTLSLACYRVYTVVVTDANGCKVTDSLNVVIPAQPFGITKYNNVLGVALYPVPAINQLNIKIADPSAEAMRFEVYDMIGNKVSEQNVSPNTHLVTIDISLLAEGNYLLRMVGSKGQKTSRFSVSK